MQSTLVLDGERDNNRQRSGLGAPLGRWHT